MRGARAIVALLILPLAGCFVQPAPEAPALRGFEARYGDDLVITFDGPVRILDRDDLVHDAYRLVFTYPKSSPYSHAEFVGADGRLIRNDRCFEWDGERCYNPGVDWHEAGGRPSDGALWPWLPDAALSLQARYDHRNLSVARDGDELRITLGEEVYLYRDGEPVPFEVRREPGPRVRTAFTWGNVLEPLQDPPLSVGRFTASAVTMFQGDDEDQFNWGYSHLDAYNGLRSLDANIARDLDQGCLLMYFADAARQPVSEGPLQTALGHPIARHGFVYADGRGVGHFKYIEGSIDQLGRPQFREASGYGLDPGSGHECPVDKTQHPGVSLGVLVDRAVGRMGPLRPEAQVRIRFGPADAPEPTYEIWDEYRREQETLDRVVLDATTGLWLTLRFTTDTPGLLERGAA